MAISRRTLTNCYPGTTPYRWGLNRAYIVFTKNDKTIDVKNGMLGTVVRVTRNQIKVSLDDEDGKNRSVTFAPNRYSNFDHGYSVTIQKSQGATVDRSFILASRSMNTPLVYVAMTRHRDGMKVYINEQDQPVWVKDRTRFRRQSLKHGSQTMRR